MMKYLLLLFALIENIFSKPESNNNNKCCNNIKLSTEYFIDQEISNLNLNFNCLTLSPFGKDKCNSHGLCEWNKKCNLNNKKCNRFPKYEYHYGKIVDVGRCNGLCKLNNSCEPNNYGQLNIDDNIVRIIKDCKCDNCGVLETSKLVEIPLGRCYGKCNTQQLDKTCYSGINDNFDSTNLEISNPSSNLILGILSQCSAGIQSGFDIFIDNRCFGHTFDCIINKPCNLKSVHLEICMQAANVQLTNTDSLILGTYGNSLWSLGLPDLNGGTWNPGEQLCLNLDLNNLPLSGVSILNNIFLAGHLDVVVQDDTAVDFINLKLVYDKCYYCLETSSVINVLYTNNGVSEHKQVLDCDCIKKSECTLIDHIHTYYPGTIYETNINVGQCIGKCNNSICKDIEFDTMKIKSPEGEKIIKKIKKCSC